jgi:hypothetical protein
MSDVEDPRLADHAVGIELELSELVEQRERARVQHRPADVERLERQIGRLQIELADTAEALATSPEPVEVDARQARDVA